MTKGALKLAWAIAMSTWKKDDEDDRDPFRELPVDFAHECVEAATKPLVKAIKNTVQSLTAIVADPMLPKDQRRFLEQIIETNQNLIKESDEKSQ